MCFMVEIGLEIFVPNGRMTWASVVAVNISTWACLKICPKSMGFLPMLLFEILWDGVTRDTR